MKLQTNNQTYPCVSFRPSRDGCVIVTGEAVPALGATLAVVHDDGRELSRVYATADYLRCVRDGCTIRLTNTPEALPVPVDLTALRQTRIAESKTALADYLAAHPLLWTDGKRYSVTSEKQGLLNNALAVYQLAARAGQDAPLTWNATGETCAVWAFDDLCALALAIAAAVKPQVSHQQALEVAINTAETENAIRAVEITYGEEKQNA